MVKDPPANTSDLDTVPGPGRSPGEGNGNPLQYSCRKNSMESGAWGAVVHGGLKVTEQQQQIYRGTCSVAQSCLTLCDPWTATRQASLSFTISQSLLKLMSIELVMPANCFILCCPLLLPSIFPSIRVFSNESALHIRWPKWELKQDKS